MAHDDCVGLTTKKTAVTRIGTSYTGKRNPNPDGGKGKILGFPISPFFFFINLHPSIILHLLLRRSSFESTIHFNPSIVHLSRSDETNVAGGI
ncbi:transmembrane protein, putative [Medicago truncatula]|uniref:Transmembrane protein, putative n=1 Tax=Medicago truncatula TaxID=3880 RepID=A0A072V944_MEDTR|nr:transmembrane protein, putative [Medicago truncatula]